MFNFVFVISFICLQWVSTLPAQEQRNGYRRVTKNGLYKVHAEPRTWRSAHLYCEAEGGHLFYPKSLAEAKLAIELLQEHFPKGADSWVGAHDMFSPGTFVDINGTSISSYYAPWESNEPTYYAWYEKCVTMHPDGGIVSQQCDSIWPFVCKKDVQNIKFNADCNTEDPDYFPNDEKTRCYKVHEEPRTWAEAYLNCHAENSYLAIVEERNEADFIVEKIKALFDKVPGNYNRTLISVGFHDKYQEGDFRTIQGKKLNTVYYEWAIGQPDEQSGDEDCGAISITGELHDTPCDNQRTLFMCERDIEAPNIL